MWYGIVVVVVVVVVIVVDDVERIACGCLYSIMKTISEITVIF